MLDYILLDHTHASLNIPQWLTEFGSVSPALTQLHVSSAPFSPPSAGSTQWAKVFLSMPSLQTVTFFEMKWHEIAVALKQLAVAPCKPTQIELRRVWDIDPNALSELVAPASGLPAIELVDCAEIEQCVNSDCSSHDLGSNCA
ncbi:hypothetical protein FRC08_017308 [Ceratobasidium sp. 394]|nr:hypothetical protein FRC08_017308 [Ceratobasidium sp. 394]